MLHFLHAFLNLILFANCIEIFCRNGATQIGHLTRAIQVSCFSLYAYVRNVVFVFRARIKVLVFIRAWNSWKLYPLEREAFAQKWKKMKSGEKKKACIVFVSFCLLVDLWIMTMLSGPNTLLFFFLSVVHLYLYVFLRFLLVMTWHWMLAKIDTCMWMRNLATFQL